MNGLRMTHHAWFSAVEREHRRQCQERRKRLARRLLQAAAVLAGLGIASFVAAIWWPGPATVPATVGLLGTTACLCLYQAVEPRE